MVVSWFVLGLVNESHSLPLSVLGMLQQRREAFSFLKFQKCIQFPFDYAFNKEQTQRIKKKNQQKSLIAPSQQTMTISFKLLITLKYSYDGLYGRIHSSQGKHDQIHLKLTNFTFIIANVHQITIKTKGNRYPWFGYWTHRALSIEANR